MNILSNLSFRQKQVLSVIFTLIVYSLWINPLAALLIVIAVGFHECSHLWAAKRLGLQTNGFFLMPFIGGVSLVSERYKSLGQQAFVVLMGPVGGGLLALATALVYHFTKIDFLVGAAIWMCYLNLFNLLPFSFMDGGQLLDTITYSINRTAGFWIKTVLTAVGVGVLFKIVPIIACLILFLGGSSLYKEYKNWKNFREGNKWECSDDYLNPPLPLTTGQMVLAIIGWVTAVGILLAVMVLLSKSYLVSFQNIFN